MLISFSVENFRSFREQQCLSFVASSDSSYASTHCVRSGVKALPRILKTAAVFGPNASGKSNLITAMQTMRHLVNSAALSDLEFSKLYTPFAFSKSIGEPTTFKIDVLIDAVRYRYTVSYNSDRIVAESLLVNLKGKSQRWFERSFDEISQKEHWQPFSPSLNGRREAWRKATRPKALFLSTAGRLEAGPFKPLLDWMEKQLHILRLQDLDAYQGLHGRLGNTQFKTRLLKCLSRFDIQIADIRVKDQRVTLTARSERSAPATGVELLRVSSHATSVWVRSSEEGAGIQRLLSLLPRLIDAMQAGHLVVIDDFDSSLHPLIIRSLVEGNDCLQPSLHRMQLLLSSHNLVLMDLALLRRDEIWLMGMDENGGSQLNSLSTMGVRKHESVANSYLRGRYQALSRGDSKSAGASAQWPSSGDASLPDAA